MRFLFKLVLLVLAAAPPALAQAPEPPSRVGQISYVSGNLGFHAAGDTQWSAAGVNYPVATGGSFWTDPQARAQIQIGPTTIGMAGGTELDVTNLNDQVSQFGLPQGRINLHLRQLDNGQSFEVDLPQGAVWLLQPGSYDIDAGTADQPARVAVFAGSAHFVGGGADIGVNHGDAAVLTGANPVTARIEHAAPDAFAEWCASRDYHAEGLAAAHYVSPQMTGYADLDHYGGWQGNPQYGEVWYPSQVPADWAPYRDGRWIWVQPWGWTWIDQQPWGFAPFHYGRWAYMDDRWGWVPGSYAAQPVYAPALVAFVGAVAGIGLAVGGPSVGWFPLAPGETYWPSYTRNVYYIRNVNVTNVKNINNIVVQSNGSPPRQVANANFANRRFATVVPQRVFANADPVAPAAIHVTPAALENAPVVLHPPQVKPSPRPASAALQGPQHPRPVPVGPGVAPPARPAAAASTVSAGQPRQPGTQPEQSVTPGRPGTAPNIASIPPRPGVANSPEHGPHPAAAGAAKTLAPGAPEPGVSHPAAVPNTAALPPSHPRAVSPAAEARPVIPAPVHPPAAANVRREAPAHPAAPPEPRPAALNEAHPVAPPHPAPPPAQAFHPPAPAVAHPPAPPPHPQPPAQALHPPAPAVARPVPAVVHPPAPPPHPQPAHAPPPAQGKPAPKEKAKEGDNHP
jgi:hypothetical protein